MSRSWSLLLALVWVLVSASGCGQGVVGEARDLWEDGQTPAAEQLLRQALDEDGENRDARLLLGEILLETDPAEAEDQLYRAGKNSEAHIKKIDRIVSEHIRRSLTPMLTVCPGRDAIDEVWDLTDLLVPESEAELRMWLMEELADADELGPDDFKAFMRELGSPEPEEHAVWDAMVEKGFRSVINGTPEERRRYIYGRSFSRKITNSNRADRLASEAMELERQMEGSVSAR